MSETLIPDNKVTLTNVRKLSQFWKNSVSLENVPQCKTTLFDGFIIVLVVLLSAELELFTRL